MRIVGTLWNGRCLSLMMVRLLWWDMLYFLSLMGLQRRVVRSSESEYWRPYLVCWGTEPWSYLVCWGTDRDGAWSWDRNGAWSWEFSLKESSMWRTRLSKASPLRLLFLLQWSNSTGLGFFGLVQLIGSAPFCCKLFDREKELALWRIA